MAGNFAETPEANKHTSIKTRVDHLDAQGQTDRLEAAVVGSVALRKGRLLGRFFADSRDSLQKAAEHLGMPR